MLELIRIKLLQFGEDTTGTETATDTGAQTTGVDTNTQTNDNTTTGEKTTEEPKTYTQKELDDIITKRLNRERKKQEKALKDTDEYKQFNEWKESQKTEQEKLTEYSEQIQKLMAANSELDQKLNMFKNKDLARQANVADQYIDFVTYEINKNINEENDFQTLLNAYVEKNQQYLNDQTKTGVTTGQRHRTNGDTSISETILKQLGINK